MDRRRHDEYHLNAPGSSVIVVFIHGINGGPGQFKPFYRFVKQQHSIANLLLPGHGGTGRDFAKSGMKKWQSYIDARMQEYVQSYPNILLVGHSMGCLLSIKAALEHAGHVRGLFLISPPLYMRLGPGGAMRALKIALGAADEKDPLISAAKYAYSIEQRALLGYLGWLPRFFELLRKGRQVRPDASRLLAPVWLIHAAKDEYVRKKSLERFGKGAKVFILPDSSHYYYPEKDRATLLSLFERFLDQTCP